MVPKTSLNRDDILPPADYAKDRRAHRQRVTALKANRRVGVGPDVTFYFENFATMWLQVHEMLHIERGGEAQIADELDAYNPLIPQGDELSATVMIEVDDPARRAATLQKLGGIENHIYIGVGGTQARGIPDPTRENTSAEGKASAVQFLRFPFTAAQKAQFRAPQAQVTVGIDHPQYGHIAIMPEAVRAALVEDFV